MTRVIKIGGRTQADPGLVRALLDAATRDRLVLVHGGGDEVSALQRRLGMTPKFHGGRRITTAEDLEIVRMVLSGTANKRLVAALVSAGVRAVGLSGEDTGLLCARATTRETLGEVGAPSRVDARVLDVLMSAGFVPVMSPVARDEDSGAPLNVNGDDAAAALAAALGADELVLVSDVPGVIAGGVLVPELGLDQVATLMEDGTVRDGMAAKLEAASRAVALGVTRVRIGDLTAIRTADAGTAITLSPTVV